MTKAPKKFSRTAVRILSAFIPSKSGRKTFRFRHSKMPAARPSNPRVCMNGQGNLVILRREEGEWINDFSMLADKLEVNINGEGNSIVLQRPPKICSSFRLFVDGNGTTIEIGPDADIGFLEARLFRGDGQRITIGRNCHFGHVELIVGDDTSLEIGNDCIFSRFIVIRTSDGHSILDMDGRILNYPHRRPVIKIGDNCWIGEHVMFTKNASTPPRTIVGACSVLTKPFEESNTIIAGNPAKVIKTGIGWARTKPKAYMANMSKGAENA